MATVARSLLSTGRSDLLSGTKRAHALDRWIYVFTAASFVAIALAGFIPDSFDKIAAVDAGNRGPFPLVLHVHAVLMGLYLLLLLAQTWLAATGRIGWHMQLGMLAAVLVPAIVVCGLILVPTMYEEVWQAAQAAPAGARDKLAAVVLRRENVSLVQLRMGLLFPTFVTIALLARRSDAGLHKRMMMLATVVVLPPAIDRILWLPNSFPANFLATEAYMLVAIAPMFIWDVIRNGHVHRAYLIYVGVSLPVAITLHSLWNTPWWHATARHMLGH